MIDENWDINIQSTKGNQTVSKQQNKSISNQTISFWKMKKRKKYYKMFNATSIDTHAHTLFFFWVGEICQKLNDLTEREEKHIYERFM